MSPATRTLQKLTSMTMTTISEQPVVTPELLGTFLSRYSSWLLGSGATCIRLEKNIVRIASAYGYEAEMTIMPRHVHISLWREGCDRVATYIATVNHAVVSFNINTALSRLSWEIADGKIDFATACSRLDSAVHGDAQNPWLVLVLVGLANASFCRLFGGDYVAMATVLVATLCGYYIKQLMLASHLDIRLTFVVCSLLSAVLGSFDALFGVGTTPDIAVGTSVLYLVPGIPFLNSFSDVLYRHYLCAISRFADALVLTCCLSAGLCAGMELMNLSMF